MKQLLLGSLVASAIVLSGCAQLTYNEGERAFLSGRYGEVEKQADAVDLVHAKSAKISPVCQIYAKLKRYDKLGRCLDELQRHVAAGDTENMDWDAHPITQGLFALEKPLIEGLGGTKAEFDITPQLWQMRAEMSMDLGDYARAVGYGEKMIAKLGPPPQPQKVTTLFGSFTSAGKERAIGDMYTRISGLGVLSLAQSLSGDRAGALKRVQDLEAYYVSNPFQKTNKQVALARTYLALGDYQRAYDVIKQDEGAFARNTVDIITGSFMMQGGSLFEFEQIGRRFMLHKAELETGRTAEAKAGYDEMLRDPATAQNGDMYWIILYDRGRIAEREGDPKSAIDFYTRAVEVIERQRSSLNTEASKIGFAGNKQNLYFDLVRLLVAQNRAAEAFGYVERSKARALVDMLASKKDFSVATGNTDQVKALLAMADSAEADARSPASADDGGKTRSLVVRTREQLTQQAPELASLVSVSTLSVQEIQARIPEGETLVEYYYGDRNLYAFVVTRTGLRVQALDGANLSAEVQAFRRALQNPAVPSAFRDPAQRLYARLVQPLALAPGRIVVVPHGALHYLPFNALNDGRQFMVERYSMRELPAASVLKFLKPGPRSEPGELLAFGNPDLGDARYDLAFAQAEVEGIVGGMAKSRALVRRQATETAFRQYSGGFRMLHIASHGEFDPDAPLKSALLLAKDAQNDGTLTVGELYSMHIDADLVTLSACETGLGKIAGGDDVVGLTRGFLYAGAGAIVASLWQVDDRATGQLMGEFYGALRRGADKREALRQAQLAMLARQPHPFYWAAFQLTGSAD